MGRGAAWAIQALLKPHGSLTGAAFPLLSLPSALLASILCLLDGYDDFKARSKTRASVRASCKSLRDAFDACNAKIDLGCRFGTPSLVLKSTRSKGKKASAHASYLDMALFIFARTPGLDNLSIDHSFSEHDKRVKNFLPKLPVACLSRLKRIQIKFALDEKMLAPLQHCSSLQELTLWVSWRTSQPNRLSAALRSLAGLRRLDLLGCDNLVDISILDKCTSLEHLSLEECRKLLVIAELPKLLHLHLKFCTSLRDITPISRMASLQTLRLHWCSHLSDLRPISALTGLKDLLLRVSANSAQII